MIALLAMGLYRKLAILASKVDRQKLVVEHYEFKQDTGEKPMVEERKGRSVLAATELTAERSATSNSHTKSS